MKKRKTNFEKIMTGAVFGGLAIVGAALLWPLKDNLTPTSSATSEIPVEAMELPEPEAPIDVSASKVDKPQAAAAKAPVDVPAVEIEAEEQVKGKAPVVAISHEDKETDFEKLALEQMDAGNVKEAFESLRKHIFVADPTAPTLMTIARLGREVGELAIAEQALLDAGALDPTSAEVHVELARMHIAARQFQEARFAARQAIRLDKENGLAWNLAGRVAMMQFHWQRAEASFRRAVQLEPTHPMIRNNLGLLYVRMGNGEAAVDQLETAVELFGDDVPHFVYNNLGLAYEKASEFEDSRDAFEQALVANPMYARARVNLERTLTKLAQLEEAEAARAQATASAEPSVGIPAKPESEEVQGSVEEAPEASQAATPEL